MGKPSKGSRKGKKAWRANISTADIDDFFELQTKDTLAGADIIPSLPNQTLFTLDKTPQDIPVQRKIEKNREKVLRYESVLQKNVFVKPIPSSTLKKHKKKEHVKEIATSQNANMEELDSASTITDIWNEKGEADNFKKCATSIIPAVEVEPPGCSFNPPFEAHQDALAQAVADEMQKMYKKELAPEPIPLTIHGVAVDEEDKFFLDADDGEDNGIEDMDKAEDGEQRHSKTKRVSRVEHNRRARRQQQLRAEEAAKKIENISKEIDCLPDIMEEISKEDEEKKKRHLRRTVAKQERLKSCPPRLGKHKFEPAPLQVLLTEEISGSIRKLKGCCTLASDRFKSLQKRGLLVPKAKSKRRK